MRKTAAVLFAFAVMASGCGESGSGDGGTGGTAGGGGVGGGGVGGGGIGGGTPCAETDCDDENPCTENLCDPADGSCSNPRLTDGTTCSADENPGRCVAGVCTGLCEFVDCDDGNDCTEDVCDPAHGSCFNPPVSDGAVCDAQGDPGRCSTGLCLGLCADVDCDDGKECTEDLCDTADGSCDHPNRPEGSGCDFDGLPGRCESGTCVDAELCSEVDCSDGNDCTEDVCNPANANCSNPNKVDGSFCQTDGNPGLCVAGRCQGLCEGVSCDDGNQCTVSMCDPSNASCPNPDKVDGTPCDYGDDPGRCSSGLCVGLCTGVVCNDHNQCTSDACDSATGSCTHTDRADGVSCDFGGVAGVCEGGECAASAGGISFDTDIQPYFGPGLANCVQCHNTNFAQAGAKLDSWANIRMDGDNGPLVVPFDSTDATAILIPQLNANHFNGPDDAGFVPILSEWIDQGALDN